MKRAMLFLAALTALTPLTCGTMFVVAGEPVVCPEQVFKDPNTCPVAISLTELALDPYENKPCFLGWVYATVGKLWTVSAPYCDPDGDPMTLTASTGTLTTKDDTYTVTGMASATGPLYVTMTLKDILSAEAKAAGDVEYTRKGTFAVIRLPANRPPSLCGGLP
jgi:hypothetical protein